MIHHGHATIKVVEEIHQCSVSLDLNMGTITAKFPNTGDKLDRVNLHDKSYYSIENLNLQLPTAKVSNGKIGNLRIIESSTINSSIFQSDLVRAFSLYKSEVGLCRLVFKPKSSTVKLMVSPFDPSGESELVYFNSILKTKTTELIRLGRGKSILVAEKDFVLIRSENSLRDKEYALTQSLSLLQRGRICLVASQVKNEVRLNFRSQNNTEPGGRIFAEREKDIEFIQAFVSHDRKSQGNKKRRFRRFVNYLIDGCSSTSSVEAMVISLFTALEIIVDENTLQKGTVTKLLGTSAFDGDLAVKVRNSLIHEGRDLADAVQYQVSVLKRYSVQVESCWYRDTYSNPKISHGFHEFLMNALLRYVCVRIGVKL